MMWTNVKEDIEVNAVITDNGYVKCTTIHEGHLINRTYIYFTKDEAIAAFKKYIRSLR